MKIRRDFVTNSSSSSYIIATKKDWRDFLNEELKEIIYERFAKYEYDKLVKLFDENHSRIDRDTVKEIAIRDRMSYWYDEYSSEYEKIANDVDEELDDLKDYNFFEVGEFDDHSSLLKESLDQNQVFCDDIASKTVKIFYMNHH